MRQRERLEPADRGLRQCPNPRQLEVRQSFPYVRLSDPQFDPPLFEPFGEGLQLSGVGVGVGVEAGDGGRRRRHGRVVHSRMAAVVARMVGRRVVPRQRAAVVVMVVHDVVHAVRVHVGWGLAHGGERRHR